ncbi:2-oxoacid:acceptor oxidoreductase family protein, partial [Candidatus Bipolaricaulota bacterium]|nr:2-oxoacid:acceptor oxidoreductase family protein [Candidatus Bipolaricaulota bacterium]
LAPGGAVVANVVAFKNIPHYPEEAAIEREIRLLPNYRLINAVDLAKEAGAIQATNMVMLGAGAPFLALPIEALETGIRTVFSDKAEAVIETNLRAFQLGFEASESAR